MNERQSLNTHYAMLNDRFEGRSARLRALGFVYTRIPEYNVAVFCRPRPLHPGKPPITIQAAFVMHADEVCWRDRIEEEEGRVLPL